MTLPSFLLGMLLASLYGTIFHVWRGGSFGRLLVFILLGWLGFWIGQVLAVISGIQIWPIGPLYVGTATLVCFLLLGIGSWLTMATEPQNP